MIELLAAAAFGAALLALAAYHAFLVAPALRAQRTAIVAHDDLLGSGGQGGSARVASLEEGQRRLFEAAERAERRLEELQALSRTDVSRIGFVRFGAYEDTGADLSYALALLNREGNGVVLSSLYSRTDTRTYGKAVEHFTPVAAASHEELQAIAIAREC